MTRSAVSRTQRSDEARGYRRLYKTKAWRLARLAQLKRQPRCERCLAKGFHVSATVVNHRKPHKGDWALFIHPENHESTCAPCHDGPIQSEERTGEATNRSGYLTTVSDSGLPTDPRHPFYQG